MGMKRPDSCKTRTYLAESLRQVEDDIKLAETAGSWTAVFQGKLLSMKLRKQLDELVRAEAAPTNQLDKIPDDEYLARLQTSAEGMADDYLEVYVRVYLERNNLTLSQGG